MKRAAIAIAAALMASTALADPLPRTGPCPWGFRPAGSYCVALEDIAAPPTIPAPTNGGPCPYGYGRQGAYCIKP
jgi:hypothetical protein